MSEQQKRLLYPPVWLAVVGPNSSSSSWPCLASKNEKIDYVKLGLGLARMRMRKKNHG